VKAQLLVSVPSHKRQNKQHTPAAAAARRGLGFRATLLVVAEGFFGADACK